MQQGKPQKILGKKYVRGKPYYKVKWQGSKKGQCTWEAPPTLKKFKAIINKYQVKNWGCPLDDKFFDVQLYRNKSFVNKKPPKKVATKQRKQIPRKKVQQQPQISSESEQSENCSSSQSGHSENQIERQQKKLFEHSRPTKKLNSTFSYMSSKSKQIHDQKSLTADEDQLQIIDLDHSQPKLINKDKQSRREQNNTNFNYSANNNNNLTKNITNINNLDKQIHNLGLKMKENEETYKKMATDNNLICIVQIQDKIQKQKQKDKDKEIQRQKQKQREKLNEKESNYAQNINTRRQDLGLYLPNQKSLEITSVPQLSQPKTQLITPAGRLKTLSFSSPIALQIEPLAKRSRILQIHHLEKIKFGNHIYLIEYQNKEMRKMDTNQFLEAHPEEFVSFLERKFRAKVL